MKKIVSVIRPFTLKQNIFVYEDGNKIDVVSADFDSIEDTLVEIAKKYEANEIELIGSKNFSKGIQHRIENVEMTKYSTNTIQVKLINN